MFCGMQLFTFTLSPITTGSNIGTAESIVIVVLAVVELPLKETALL